MNQYERRGWLIVATLFAVLALVFGSAWGTIGVFVPALLKTFPHWSRARVSLLPSAMAFSAGIGTIPIGWLLDRVEAKFVMIAGTVGAGSAFLIASGSNSLAPLIGCYLLLGIGLSAATLGPAAFVLANWFEARRGLAMGIAFSGVSAGVMTMTLLGNYVIQGRGWRTAYVALGLPIILLVVPLIALAVRSRPPGAMKMTVAQGASLLEGFETLTALRCRSFWMLVVAGVCFGIGASGTVVHLIAYLQGLGYKAGSAALAMSILAGLAAFGKLGMGHIADRIGARLALTANLAAGALAFVTLLSAANTISLALFILIGGVAIYAPLVLLPLLVAESLGRRRYGVLSALTSLAHTFAAAIGPVVAGRIFDLTGSYAGAFKLFIVLNALGAVAAFACQPYAESVQIRLVPAPTSA